MCIRDRTKPDAAAAAATVAEDAAAQPPAVATDETARLSDEIVNALKTVYDPEILSLIHI